MQVKHAGWAMLLALLITGMAQAAPDTSRSVVIGSGLTEILYALGVEDRIVGVGDTSTWPPEIKDKPHVGYTRTLSAEGILSLSPSLVLVTDEAGPKQVLKNIENSGVTVKPIPAARSVDDVKDTIRELADLFDRKAAGEKLSKRLDASLTRARQRVAAHDAQPRVLFVLSGDGHLMAAGKDTAADAIIRLAGGRNVAADQRGYKPLSPEVVAKRKPEVILTMDMVGHDETSRKKLLQHPALKLTPAARSKRVITMSPQLLLGFGPRLGQAVDELAKQLYSQDERS